jgi:hypothetical protein
MAPDLDLPVCQEKTTKVTLSDPLAIPTSCCFHPWPGPVKNDNTSQWSLALSRLKFCGGPVNARSEESLHHVPFEDLWLAALGAILRHWEVPASGIVPYIVWFNRLREFPETDPTSSNPELP